jgi:hypothetical protein
MSYIDQLRLIMTDDEINHLRGLCNAATPGPWICSDGGCVKSASVTREKKKGEAMTQVALAIEAPIDEETRVEPHNARFIAAAREALPRLIDEVQFLRGRNWTDLQRLANDVCALVIDDFIADWGNCAFAELCHFCHRNTCSLCNLHKLVRSDCDPKCPHLSEYTP